MTTEEREWLNSLLLVDEGLNNWELNFIDHIDQENPHTLTKKQHDKLEQLFMWKGL